MYVLTKKIEGEVLDPLSTLRNYKVEGVKAAQPHLPSNNGRGLTLFQYI